MERRTGSMTREAGAPECRTVLCVDPDPSCAAALQDAWMQLHLADDLYVVRTPEEALDFLFPAQDAKAQQSLAALVLDPDAIGEESEPFMCKVRKHCGKDEVPIVFWSRNNDKSKVLEGRGMEWVIKKPMTLRLIQSLDDVCRLSVQYFRPFAGNSSISGQTME